MDELRKRQKIISQLVEARLEQGISQAELARRLGIQRSGINRLESGTQNPTLDMILKIASALGKDVSLELNDKEEPMSNVYSLRIYDTELMRFSMEKQGLSGLVAEILYTNEEQAHLLPLDMERTGEGVIHWLQRRVIPKNRAFVDEILKTLGLSHNDTKGIIDVCKGLSLNDSYWVVPEGFEGEILPIQSLRKSLFRDTGAGGLYRRRREQAGVYHIPGADHRRYAAQGVAICGARWDLSLQGRHDRRVQCGPGAVLRVLCFADCGNHASERRAL